MDNNEQIKQYFHYNHELIREWALEFGMTRQAFSQRMMSNAWDLSELKKFKDCGIIKPYYIILEERLYKATQKDTIGINELAIKEIEELLEIEYKKIMNKSHES